MAASTDRQGRILVLGIEHLQFESEDVKIESFAWSQYQEVPKVGNFDHLVLTLSSVDEEMVTSGLWNRIRGQILDTSEVAKVYRNNGDILVFGSQLLKLNTPEPNEVNLLGHMLGVSFEWDTSEGDNIDPPDMETAEEYGVQRLVHAIDEFKYSLHKVTAVPPLAKLDVRSQEDIRGEYEVNRLLTPILLTNFGRPIVFVVEPRLRATNGNTFPFGHIISVPESGADPREAVCDFLTDRYGIVIKEREPEWAAGITVPGQEVLDSGIKDAEGQIQTLSDALEQLRSRRAETRRILRLLYDTGLGLEEIVRDALEDLGGEIEVPEENLHDGLLRYRGGSEEYFGVYEVKSRNRPHGKSPLEQLHGWQFRRSSEEEGKPKGILFLNSEMDKPYEERAEVMTEDNLALARVYEFVVVPTGLLYAVHCNLRNDKPALVSFWEGLFTKTGLLTEDDIPGL